VPTVERGVAPIRSWSTMIVVVRASSGSTSGRASVCMKPCTKALEVSLINCCDSAAMVPNTSEHFARAGDAGEHRQLALRDLDAHVFEVVHARPARGSDRGCPQRAVQAAACPSSWPCSFRSWAQLTALFTSAPIFASSAAVNSFSAKEVGHMAPSSRFAASLNPNVAYLDLNFCAL
jgi:hypothetical protein